MPPGFAFPERAELYVPLAPEASTREQRGGFWLPVVGRMKPGVDIATAHNDLQVIGERIERQFPENEGYGVRAVSMLKYQVRDIASGLWLMLAVVAGVLLIACANLANLMLVRASAHRRALAVRAALGATRWVLVRHQLAEAVVLAVVGAVLGIGLAWLSLRGLQSLVATLLPRADNVSLDLGVLLFTTLVTLATVLAFGVLPALGTSRVKGSEALREGGRGQQGGRFASASRSVLVVAQVAIAMTLLVGAGLALRSFWNLLEVDPGLDLDRAAVTRLGVPATRYPDAPPRLAFMGSLVERLAATPGIEAASFSSSVRMQHIHTSSTFTIEGRPPVDRAQRAELPIDSVWPGYFDVLGVRVVAGRAIDARDTAESTAVAMVNETFAKAYFPNGDAVGARYVYGDPDADGDSPPNWITIVGVVQDYRHYRLPEPMGPALYMPIAAYAPSMETVVIRVRSGDPAAVLPSARRVIGELDPEVPPYRVLTFEQATAASLWRQRFQGFVVGVFAGLALLLAAVGIYGVISYAVAQRTREFGVRAALGAQVRDIMMLVLRSGARLAAAGVTLGLLGGLSVTRYLESLLYEVRPRDPAIFALVALGLGAVALIAVSVPAWRATSVDPLVAMRPD
jgi:putative ABC transport system permease protein